MVPSHDQIEELWNTCNLPEYKRGHSKLVARVARWFAREIMKHDPSVHIDMPLLSAAALLHDIDKAIPRQGNERHPDTGVRILRTLGYQEVSDLVRTHPLHAILDQTIAPTTWEEKILYLSDKMVKQTIISVDERFRLWRDEGLPQQAIHELAQCYPKVKALEKELCAFIQVKPEDVVRFASSIETSTIG